MFRHEVKCCVDKKGTACWYVFTGTIWEEDYRAVYLRKKISKEVSKIYKCLIAQWYKQKDELANGKVPDYLYEKSNNGNFDSSTEIKKLDEMIKKGYKQLGILTKNYTKKQLIDECVIFFNDYNLASKFNKNPYLMAFNNGIYDFQENKFRPGYPDDMITFSTHINYVKEQDTNDIQKFMQSILPNKDTRKYIYSVLASTFPGIIVDQVFHFFTGSGSNGKSVLSIILKYALGDYFMATVSTMFTRKERGVDEATPVKAQLPGKRVLIVSETSKSDVINETVFKRSCCGDPDIARPLYRPPFEFIPQYTPIMLVNHIPEMNLMDYSMYRRTRNVYFPMTFKPKEELDQNNPYESAIDKKLSDLLT
jgi:P4 family phage/plasmid primase-like protien